MVPCDWFWQVAGGEGQWPVETGFGSLFFGNRFLSLVESRSQGISEDVWLIGFSRCIVWFIGPYSCQFL